MAQRQPQQSRGRSRSGPLLVVLVGVLGLVAISGLAGRSVVASRDGTEVRALAYVATEEGAVLLDGPGGHAIQATGVGIPLAVIAEDDAGYTVLTACNDEVWVDRATTTRGTAAKGDHPVGSAVIVIDPGHGGPDTGAVAASGLTEKEANLDVASRLGDLLDHSRTVDWETGEVGDGGDIPPVAAVVLTRNPDGAVAGDHRVGNRFRAELANLVEADALVSIHHNASAHLTLPSPGSEVYYSHDDPQSRRLAGLIAEELLTGLAVYDVSWSGGERAGASARVGPDGDDYYSLLAWSGVPAVIVEALYLSNPPEAALAATDEFRDTYAEAVYRALIRFLTTDDVGGPVHEPAPYDGGPAATLGQCSLPAPDD